MVDGIGRGKRPAPDSQGASSSLEPPAVRARHSPARSDSPDGISARAAPAGDSLAPRNATLSAVTAPAAAATTSPPVAVVSRGIFENLKTASAALAEARQLLDLGPQNQLFSLVAQRGRQQACGLIKHKIELEAQSLAGHYQDSASGSAAAQLAIGYMTQKKVPTVAASAGTVYEPGLIGINAGFRTGACTDYAFVAMLCAMQSMLRARRPFELRLVQLGDRHEDDVWIPGRAWNADHVVAVLGMPGVNGPEELVLIDPWVERARPVLLSEVQYASGERPWNLDQPLVSVAFDGRQLLASARDDEGDPRSRRRVDITTWPTPQRLHALQGTLSSQELLRHLEAGRVEHEARGNHVAASDVVAFIEELQEHEAESAQLFDPDAKPWKADSKPLLDVPVYQMDQVPGSGHAQLYRTSSGSESLAVDEQVFSGDPGTALSPRSRADAQDRVATLDPEPWPGEGPADSAPDSTASPQQRSP
jgi:hypothetical protein